MERVGGDAPCPLSAREGANGCPGEISMCTRTNCACTDICPLACTTANGPTVGACGAGVVRAHAFHMSARAGDRCGDQASLTGVAATHHLQLAGCKHRPCRP